MNDHFVSIGEGTILWALPFPDVDDLFRDWKLVKVQDVHDIVAVIGGLFEEVFLNSILNDHSHWREPSILHSSAWIDQVLTHHTEAVGAKLQDVAPFDVLGGG